MWRLKRDVCVCWERREGIKGVVVCSCRCIVVEGQLLGLAFLSLWFFLTCISFSTLLSLFPESFSILPQPQVCSGLFLAPQCTPHCLLTLFSFDARSHPALSVSSCSVPSAEIKALQGSRALPAFCAGYQLKFSFFLFNYATHTGKRTFWKSGLCF